MSPQYKKDDGSTVIKGKDGKIKGNLPAAHKQPKTLPDLPQKAPKETADASKVVAPNPREVESVALVGEYWCNEAMGYARRGEITKMGELKKRLQDTANNPAEHGEMRAGAAAAVLRLTEKLEPAVQQNSKNSRTCFCRPKMYCRCDERITVDDRYVPETFGNYMNNIYLQEKIAAGVDEATAREILAFTSRNGYLPQSRMR